MQKPVLKDVVVASFEDFSDSAFGPEAEKIVWFQLLLEDTENSHEIPENIFYVAAVIHGSPRLKRRIEVIGQDRVEMTDRIYLNRVIRKITHKYESIVCNEWEEFYEAISKEFLYDEND